MKTVGVRFRRAGKVYTFSSEGFECRMGDYVVVDTERGVSLGRVSSLIQEQKETGRELKKVLRIAVDADLEKQKKNNTLETEARVACVELCREKNLQLKLLDVECLFDNSKVIFYFTSEGRVDFRELVRDLARRFHTRIEMRQVGVRDEAKIVGGLGACGRELCCATWLTEFAPIGVRMAKSQNISLNPAKISGICGRLMCCLAYENRMYEEMMKGMPKIGKRVAIPQGEGKVIRRNALDGTFVVLTEQGEVELTVENYDRFLSGNPEPVGEVAVAAPAQEEKPRGRPTRGAPPPRGPRPQVSAPAAEPKEEEEASESKTQGEPAQDDQKSPRRRRRRRKKTPHKEEVSGNE